MLDLFSGTGSVKKATALLENDFECLSLDTSDKFSKPDVLIDIHDWDYKVYPPGHFDVIGASVPCQMYSCARTRATTPRDIPAANRNVERVLDMVAYFAPAVFWIENPVIIICLVIIFCPNNCPFCRCPLVCQPQSPTPPVPHHWGPDQAVEC